MEKSFCDRKGSCNGKSFCNGMVYAGHFQTCNQVADWLSNAPRDLNSEESIHG